MMTTAVLGCGTIGASWVEAFLAQGLRVTVWDPRPREQLSIHSPHDSATSSLRSVDTPAEAVAGARFVQENGPEDLAVKRKLYAEIEGALGKTQSSPRPLRPFEPPIYSPEGRSPLGCSSSILSTPLT